MNPNTSFLIVFHHLAGVLRQEYLRDRVLQKGKRQINFWSYISYHEISFIIRSIIGRLGVFWRINNAAFITEFLDKILQRNRSKKSSFSGPKSFLAILIYLPLWRKEQSHLVDVVYIYPSDFYCQTVP